jgi:hypothetical protein
MYALKSIHLTFWLFLCVGLVLLGIGIFQLVTGRGVTPKERDGDEKDESDVGRGPTER